MSLPNYANLEFGNNNMVSASKKIMNFERQASEIYKQQNADPLTSTGTSPKDAVDEMLLGLNEINANISQLKTYTDESKRKERKYAPTQEAFENAIETEANRLGNIPEKIPQINLHKSIDTGTFQPFKLTGSGIEEREEWETELKGYNKMIKALQKKIDVATDPEEKAYFENEIKDLQDAKDANEFLIQSDLEQEEKPQPKLIKVKKAKEEPEIYEDIEDPEQEQDIKELNKNMAQLALFNVDEDDFNTFKQQGQPIIKEYQHKKMDGSIVNGYAKYPEKGDLPKSKKYSTYQKDIEKFKFKFGTVDEGQVKQIQAEQVKETIQQRIDEGLIDTPTLNPIISVLTKLTTLIAKQSVLFNGRIKKNINFLDRVELDNLVNAVNKSIALFNAVDFDFIAVVINNGNNMINNVVNAFNKLSKDLYLGAQSYTTTYKGGMILNHLHGRTVRQNPYNYKYLM